jgi:hypothetical protein
MTDGANKELRDTPGSTEDRASSQAERTFSLPQQEKVYDFVYRKRIENPDSSQDLTSGNSKKKKAKWRPER